MKNFVAAIAATLFATATFAQDVQEESALPPGHPAIEKPALKAPDSPVVRVGDETRLFCTGVFLEKSHYVLTAGHCIANELSAHFKVWTVDGQTLKAEIALFASSDGGMADFALLYITEELPAGWKGAELGCETVPIGTEIEGIGYPGTFGGTLVHRWGRIATEPKPLFNGQFPLPVYGAQLSLAKGDSGGPIFTLNGILVATMIAYNPEQTGFAVLQPVKPVCDLLEE